MSRRTATILADDDEEKGRRIEALSAIGDFIERAMPLITQVPESAPMLLDALMFTIRSFRGGRQLEASIESFVDQVKQKLQQQAEQPEQPDPAQQAAEAEAQAKQQQTQIEGQAVQQKAQADIAVTQAKAQAAIQTTQAQQQNATMAAALDRQGQVAQAEADMKKAQTDAYLNENEIAAKMQELDIEREKLILDRHAMRQKALATIAEQEAKKDA